MIRECAEPIVRHRYVVHPCADRDIRWIQQQGPVRALACARVHLAVEGQRAFARRFHKAAVAAIGTATSFDAAVKGRIAISPHHHLAAVAGVECVGLDARIRAEHGRVRCWHATLAMQVATHQHCAATGRARGVDCRVAEQANAVTQHLNSAAGLAGTRAGRGDGAGHNGVSTDGAQGDHALMVLNGARLDDASVIDHAGQQFVPGACAHQHGTAVGADQAAVLAQVVQRALVHLHLHQAVALEAQRDGAASAECHGAKLCGYGALVADAVAQQRHVAAIARRDIALVDDAAGALAAEAARVAVQAAVIEVQGGGDQRANVDLRALSKQDAVRVDEPDLPVGIQMPKNLTALSVEDAVDRNGAGGGLQEVDCFLRREVEALPAEREVLTGLLDVGRVAKLIDAAGAGINLAAGRAGQGDAG